VDYPPRWITVYAHTTVSVVPVLRGLRLPLPTAYYLRWNVLFYRVLLRRRTLPLPATTPILRCTALLLYAFTPFTAVAPLPTALHVCFCHFCGCLPHLPFAAGCSRWIYSRSTYRLRYLTRLIFVFVYLPFALHYCALDVAFVCRSACAVDSFYPATRLLLPTFVVIPLRSDSRLFGFFISTTRTLRYAITVDWNAALPLLRYPVHRIIGFRSRCTRLI